MFMSDVCESSFANRWKEGNVLVYTVREVLVSSDLQDSGGTGGQTLIVTFYLWLHGIKHMVMDHLHR